LKTLFVMYDSRCGLCTGARDWLRLQPSYLDLRLMASDSEEARRLFPGLPSGELAVVSNDGRVWLGDNAFIMCLWALRKYRRWAKRLASPILRPVARQAFEAISRNRKNVSSLLRLKSETELKNRLNEVTISTCPMK
jgi:predicted DCC family thiol-disulfide oxidoreductase YuxK